MFSTLPAIQNLCRRFLGFDERKLWRSSCRLLVFAIAGFALTLAGWRGAERNASRALLAKKQSAMKAEQRRLADEANAKVETLVKEAEIAWKLGALGTAADKLESASKTPNATNLASVRELASRMANARVEELVLAAKKDAMAGEVSAASTRLKAALAVPNATDISAARELHRQIALASDTAQLRSALMGLPDNVLQESKKDRTVPPPLASGYVGLDERVAELAMPQVDQILNERENRRLEQLAVQRKAQESARIAADAERHRKAVAEAEAGARRAESDRKRKAAEAEAERKAEEERDVDGLIVLLKTVEGRRGQFGAEITGTVINRRSRKLSYAQISFNLYDASGAQVGSAHDNINGLEPGGSWKFKATSFGTDFSKYKFSELTGF